jgi:hypothetical protein
VGQDDSADVGEALAQVVVLEVLIGRPHVHPQPVGTLVRRFGASPVQQLSAQTLAAVSAVDRDLVGIQRRLGRRGVVVVLDDEGLPSLDVAQRALDHQVLGRPGLLPLVDALAGQPGGGLVPESDQGVEVLGGGLGDAHQRSRSTSVGKVLTRLPRRENTEVTRTGQRSECYSRHMA